MGYPREPDDHIGTELSFLAELATRAYQYFNEKKTPEFVETLIDHRNFLEQHPLRWYKEFSNRINNLEGISEFYPAFAQLASLVCSRDVQVIESILSEI